MSDRLRLGVAYLFDDVVAEAMRAHDKFGAQLDVPDGAGAAQPFLYYLPPTPTMGTLCHLQRDSTDAHAQSGSLTWADILLEEVFEACSEDDVDRLRVELVQVASTALRQIAAIDARSAGRD